jgi:hypothetical protein
LKVLECNGFSKRVFVHARMRQRWRGACVPLLPRRGACASFVAPFLQRRWVAVVAAELRPCFLPFLPFLPFLLPPLFLPFPSLPFPSLPFPSFPVARCSGRLKRSATIRDHVFFPLFPFPFFSSFLNARARAATAVATTAAAAGRVALVPPPHPPPERHPPIHTRRKEIERERRWAAQRRVMEGRRKKASMSIAKFLHGLRPRIGKAPFTPTPLTVQSYGRRAPFGRIRKFASPSGAKKYCAKKNGKKKYTTTETRQCARAPAASRCSRWLAHAPSEVCLLRSVCLGLSPVRPPTGRPPARR